MGIRVTAPPAQAEDSRAPELWADLIARMARGDQGALAEFYDATAPVRLWPGIAHSWRRTKRGGGNAGRLVSSLEAAGRYSPERGSALAWLLNMARSRAIDRPRSKPRRHHERPMGAVEEVRDRTLTPERTSLTSRHGLAVQAAMGALQAPQREAIELAHFSGFGHSQIARRLGEPLDAVKTRIRLGMLRLRESLQPRIGAL